MKRKIQAVIFDMDGLMLDTQRIATQVWQQAATECGFTLSDEQGLAMIGRNPQGMNAVLIETFGTDFPLEACRNRANELYLASITQQGVQVKPGLWELLDFLGQESIATAVATSTPRELTTYHLNQTRLISRFKAIVTGDEIQHGKPAPDIFLSAATAINVSPDKCVVLEDSFPGIQAAHAAKMIPIMVPDLKPPTEEIKAMAYAIVPSLYEAKEVIAGLLNEETESQLR